MNAKELDAQYGELLRRPPYSEARSAFLLKRCIEENKPCIKTTTQALKTWIAKYRSSGASVSDVDELEREYGAICRALVFQGKKAYAMRKALSEREPPVSVTQDVCHNWIRKYGFAPGTAVIRNAGHLELQWGSRIRADDAASGMDAGCLQSWMRVSHSVTVDKSVCQKWLSSDWSTSGKYLSSGDLERDAGDRLRLEQYRYHSPPLDH